MRGPRSHWQDLVVLRSLVRMHAVHPAGISLDAHYKKRVVRKRDGLRRALGGEILQSVIRHVQYDCKTGDSAASVRITPAPRIT